jgi:hypothetical protein
MQVGIGPLVPIRSPTRFAEFGALSGDTDLGRRAGTPHEVRPARILGGAMRMPAFSAARVIIAGGCRAGLPAGPVADRRCLLSLSVPGPAVAASADGLIWPKTGFASPA